MFLSLQVEEWARVTGAIGRQVGSPGRGMESNAERGAGPHSAWHRGFYH